MAARHCNCLYERWRQHGDVGGEGVTDGSHHLIKIPDSTDSDRIDNFGGWSRRQIGELSEIGTLTIAQPSTLAHSHTGAHYHTDQPEMMFAPWRTLSHCHTDTLIHTAANTPAHYHALTLAYTFSYSPAISSTY